MWWLSSPSFACFGDGQHEKVAVERLSLLWHLHWHCLATAVTVWVMSSSSPGPRRVRVVVLTIAMCAGCSGRPERGGRGVGPLLSVTVAALHAYVLWWTSMRERWRGDGHRQAGSTGCCACCSGCQCKREVERWGSQCVCAVVTVDVNLREVGRWGL